jgi:periplasmic protein TonB
MRTALAVSLLIHALFVLFAFRMKAHKSQVISMPVARLQITIMDSPDPVPPSALPTEAPITGRPASPDRAVRAGLVRRSASRGGDSASTPPLDVPDKSSPTHQQDESSDGPQVPGESEASAAPSAPVAAAVPGPGVASQGMVSPAGSAPSGGQQAAPHWERIGQAIRRQVVYPLLARRRGMQGRTTVSFVVGTSGMASEVRIVVSSGYPLLDAAALEAVARAVPLPAPNEPTEIVMPIVFALQ